MLADPTFSLSDSAPDSSFIPTFAQEELALKAEVKKAFLGDDDGSDGEDDLLVKRSKTKDERQREDEEYEAFLKTNAGDRAVEDALEQEEKFLRE
jgi:protein KRI1